jgi:hypothetical protein
MRQNFLSGTLLAGGRIEDALGSFFAVHFSGTIIFPLEPLSFHWNHYLSISRWFFEFQTEIERDASDDLRLIPGLGRWTPCRGECFTEPSESNRCGFKHQILEPLQFLDV